MIITILAWTGAFLSRLLTIPQAVRTLRSFTACIAAIDRSRMPLTTKWPRTSRIIRCRNNLGYLSAPVPSSRPGRVLSECRTTLNAGPRRQLPTKPHWLCS